jgi:hypothetical protein
MFTVAVVLAVVVPAADAPVVLVCEWLEVVWVWLLPVWVCPAGEPPVVPIPVVAPRG